MTDPTEALLLFPDDVYATVFEYLGTGSSHVLSHACLQAKAVGDTPRVRQSLITVHARIRELEAKIVKAKEELADCTEVVLAYKLKEPGNEHRFRLCVERSTHLPAEIEALWSEVEILEA